MNEAERRFLKSRERGPDPWFEADPDRRAARDGMERIWSDLDALPELACLAPAPRRSRRWVLAGGAALAAAVAAVAVLPRADLATAKGERRSVTLPDGSVLVLDAGSSADLRFQADARVLRLTSGRADFHVVPAARRMVVLCDAGRVHVPAGHVTVHLWADDMTVACHTGEALVTIWNGGEVALAAGQEVSFGPSGTVTQPVSRAETEWQSGRLVFEDRPLRQVVADIGRYRAGRILLRGAVADLRVTGVFDATRPDLALDAITAALPVARRDLGPLTLLTSA